MNIFRKLDSVEARYDELARLMSDPEVNANPKLFQQYAREHSSLGDVVELYQAFRKMRLELDGAQELMLEKDPEIKEMAKADIDRLQPELDDLERRLKIALLPKDPNDAKNVILEIRAGTGGEEAGLFAAELFRMYTRYAERRGWKVEILSSSDTGMGGFKEIIASLSGQMVYSRLKYEAGVHRVQRVPATEAQGRIHTSAVTVAILPEAEEVDLDIAAKDLRIDVYRSSGPGGQSVNTTDSAVRITHIPSGVSVACQDEKSQLKNKVKAMKILRSRLYEHAVAQQHAEISAQRKEMVGSGDRSAKIRTYNFPQSRLTDHRIGLTLYNLETVVSGDLDQVIDPLITHYQAEALQGVEEKGSAA
jgi:peptide chain release factor 1